MEKGSNTEKTLGFIDRNKKAIITSSFVLLGVILIYKAYKRFSITIDDKIDDEIEETGEGLIKSQMTITEEQANNFAQILLDDHFKPRNLVYWLRSELSPLDGAVYKIVKHRVESAGFTF